MATENRFLQFVKEHELFALENRILLAVSGGKDSVLMAHLFAKTEISFGIAHCNFQLRGTDAEADEALVRDLAAHLKVPFYVIHFNTQEFAVQHGLSIQMAARALRYEWFEEIRLQNDYHYIAIAQHQNDTAETILLNLVRGTGVAGLQGILPKRNKVIRPLLFLKAEEIEQLVKEWDLSFRDDTSNFSTKYARNKIRLEVIPKLKEINPTLEQTFIENGKRFEELNNFLKAYVGQLRNRLFMAKSKASYEVKLKELQALNPLRTLLYELFRPFGFTAAILEDLIQVWNRPDHSGKCFCSPSYKIMLDRTLLTLEELHRQEDTHPVFVFPGEYKHFNCYKVGLGWPNAIQKKEEYKEKHHRQIVLDADDLIFPIQIRSWQNGDRFQPLGMKGKKKLSDFFISLKLAKNDKNKVPVFLNGNGDIIWVAPYRMDDRYKITNKTKKVITLECL